MDVTTMLLLGVIICVALCLISAEGRMVMTNSRRADRDVVTDQRHHHHQDEVRFDGAIEHTLAAHILAFLQLTKKPYVAPHQRHQRKLLKALRREDIVVVDQTSDGFRALLDLIRIDYVAATYEDLTNGNVKLNTCQLLLVADGISSAAWSTHKFGKRLRRVLRSFTSKGGTLVGTGRASVLNTPGKVFSGRLEEKRLVNADDLEWTPELVQEPSVADAHTDIHRNSTRSSSSTSYNSNESNIRETSPPTVPPSERYAMCACQSISTHGSLSQISDSIFVSGLMSRSQQSNSEWLFPRSHFVREGRKRARKTHVIMHSGASNRRKLLLMCFNRHSRTELNRSGQVFYFTGPILQTHQLRSGEAPVIPKRSIEFREIGERLIKHVRKISAASQRASKDMAQQILLQEYSVSSLRRAALSIELLFRILLQHFLPKDVCREVRGSNAQQCRITPQLIANT
eukprot:scpid50255/ scgid14996/ 